MSYRILRVVVIVIAAILPLRASPVAADSGSMPAITAIDAGSYHTCALTSGGGVKCWGYNDGGQLGNGTTTNSRTPVDVTDLASGVSAIAAGGNHTCALTNEGGVRCWGYNISGQIGNGTTTNSLTPVDVTDLASGVSAIAAGGGHTCALTNEGGVRCWGSNNDGELGNGSGTGGSTRVGTPVDVSGLASGVRAIAAGAFFTCALTNERGVKCWGYNLFGQLGNGTTRNSSIPIDVSGLASGVSAITVNGEHACALTDASAVKCWGHNGVGQLGNGSTTGSTIPVDVLGLSSSISAIGSGQLGGHTCVVTSTGGIRCWGWNEDGQLGNGTTTNSSIPIDVSGLASGVEAVTAGYSHTCALASGGGVECWGRNNEGQLGNGTTTASRSPVDVDLTSLEPPQTDTADRGVRDRPADFPLLPLLAGLAAGITMLVGRRAKESDRAEIQQPHRGGSAGRRRGRDRPPPAEREECPPEWWDLSGAGRTPSQPLTWRSAGPPDPHTMSGSWAKVSPIGNNRRTDPIDDPWASRSGRQPGSATSSTSAVGLGDGDRGGL